MPGVSLISLSLPVLSCPCSSYSLTVTDLGFHIISMPPAYLPDPVRTINAEARILKEASTAPMAMASAGSVEGGKQRRRSSNTSRWNMAASASRAIWCSRHVIQQEEHSRERQRGKTHTYMRQEGVMNRSQCESRVRRKRWQEKRGGKKQKKQKQGKRKQEEEISAGVSSEEKVGRKKQNEY